MSIEIVRWFAALVLSLFTGYTVYCATTENFLKSFKKILVFKWGRQVTMDVYLGLALFSFFIYLNEGSLLTAWLWMIPTMVFGNIIPLLYFVIYFDSLVHHFR